MSKFQYGPTVVHVRAAVGRLEDLLELQVDVLAVVRVGDDVLVVVGLDARVVAGQIVESPSAESELASLPMSAIRVHGPAGLPRLGQEDALAAQVESVEVSCTTAYSQPPRRAERGPADRLRVDVTGRRDPVEAPGRAGADVEAVVLSSPAGRCSRPSRPRRAPGAVRARHRDHVRDRRARSGVVRARLGAQHQLPGGSRPQPTGTPVQAVAGRGVDVAADPDDAEGPGAVQLVRRRPAARCPSPWRAGRRRRRTGSPRRCWPRRCRPITEPSRGSVASAPTGQPRQAGVDSVQVLPVVRRAPHAAAGRARRTRSRPSAVSAVMRPVTLPQPTPKLAPRLTGSFRNGWVAGPAG